jgi:uncharacterized membrane protein YphA (DoxX/SURF4 family)
MGVPYPHFMAWLTILTALLGGLAVLLGAFVTIVSVPMMAVLWVAMFTVHLPYGLSSIKRLAVTATGAQFGPVGYEVALLYVACLAALVTGGSGPCAIDGLTASASTRGHATAGFRHQLGGNKGTWLGLSATAVAMVVWCCGPSLGCRPNRHVWRENSHSWSRSRTALDH